MTSSEFADAEEPSLEDNSNVSLNIAIVGGGLVGAFTAIALSHLKNVKVTLYEKTPTASEVGAWIAVTNSGLEVLRNFVDIEELNKIIYRGNPIKTHVTRYWKSGEVLAVNKGPPLEDDLIEARTHRVPLHNTILKYVPEGIIKYSHKVKDVKIKDEKVILNFENGKEEQADLVVAADGIHSKIRLQHYPSTRSIYKGKIAYRTVFPESLLDDIELPNDVSSWSKGGEVVYMSRLGLGQYGFVGIIPGPDKLAENLRWNRNTEEWGIKHLKDHFKDWDPLILKVLERMPAPNAFPLENAPWLDNLSLDNKIVFVGDAAHPTSGAYGAGSAFGFGDAWALYRSLQETSSNYWIETTKDVDKYNVPLALDLYNKTRVPFLKRVQRQLTIDSSVTKNYLKQTKSEEEEKARLKMVSYGFYWMRAHSVEFQFQEIRDGNMELLQENLKRFLIDGNGVHPDR